MYDFFFHSKVIGRFLFFLQQSKIIFKFSDIFKINLLFIFFDLKNILDINSIFVVNYIYFFKFFFGYLPFFFNYESKFKLNIYYYSFKIQYKFYKNKIYFPLYFFINDIYMFNLNLDFDKVTKYNFKYIIKDMNFFLEKKNSLGFYNLKHNIVFEIILKNILILKEKLLFSIFKLKI
jgi:hypothetical protein